MGHFDYTTPLAAVAVLQFLMSAAGLVIFDRDRNREPSVWLAACLGFSLIFATAGVVCLAAAFRV